MQLTKKDKMNGLLGHNKSTIEKSLTNIDDYLNKSSRNNLSPSYSR